jgi:hypothetical protein
MAMIHVSRGATSLGAFSEEEVREGLRTGRFVSTDLGWREGMPSWKPLSDFPDLAGVAPRPAEAPPPQAPTTPMMIAPAAEATTGASVVRDGLPWERREELGFVNAFVQTVAIVLTRPAEAFTVMRTEGGLGDPLLFGAIGGSIGAIVWILLSAVLHSLGWFDMLSRQGSLQNYVGASVGGAVLVFRVILTPILIVIGLFIWAALVHVCLMLLGGANKTFETTFRALSFAYGATALLAIIPCCGGLIALIWGLIADCIGISRSHETDTGRAVMAVILPLIVCCGGIFLLCLVLGVGIGALMQHANQ